MGIIVWELCRNGPYLRLSCHRRRKRGNHLFRASYGHLWCLGLNISFLDLFQCTLKLNMLRVVTAMLGESLIRSKSLSSASLTSRRSAGFLKSADFLLPEQFIGKFKVEYQLSSMQTYKTNKKIIGQAMPCFTGHMLFFAHSRMTSLGFTQIIMNTFILA